MAGKYALIDRPPLPKGEEHKAEAKKEEVKKEEAKKEEPPKKEEKKEEVKKEEVKKEDHKNEDAKTVKTEIAPTPKGNIIDDKISARTAINDAKSVAGTEHTVNV